MLDLHIGTRPQSGDGGNTLAMDIGLVVAHIRKVHQASTAQMAGLFGCSQALLLKWESGQAVPSAPNLHRIFRHAGSEAILFVLGRPLENEHSALKSEVDAHLGPDGTPFSGEAIGLILRTIRTARGISQAELARVLSVSQGLIARLEAGGEVSSIPVLERILRLARETGEQVFVGPKTSPIRLRSGSRRASKIHSSHGRSQS